MFKNIITTVILAFTMLISTVAYSGEGHSHSPSVQPTNEQVMSKVFQDLAIIVDKSELVEGKTLDKSWKDVTNKKCIKNPLGTTLFSLHMRKRKKHFIYF
jgi:hypothetical protein